MPDEVATALDLPVETEMDEDEQRRQAILDRAYALRAFLDSVQGQWTEQQAADNPDMIALWNPGQEYLPDERVRYEGHVYRVLQTHVSQLDWTPDLVPALYAKLRTSQEEREEETGVEPWEQPTAENPYMKGDRVSHGGVFWESLVDNNVWEPSTTTQALGLWKNIDLQEV